MPPFATEIISKQGQGWKRTEMEQQLNPAMRADYKRFVRAEMLRFRLL